MASFEVLVINEDHKGLRGIRVALEFTDPTRGMTSPEYTDLEGVAYFEGHDEGEIRVYIDGINYGIYDYRDRSQVTIIK